MRYSEGKDGDHTVENVISRLFSDYLSEQTIAADPAYALLAKSALKQERDLRNRLTEEQTACFEELFELTSQIHFLEIKDAFFCACKLGANASKEFVI